jgi:C-terminal processing protease CtpA/Prc
MGLHITVAKWIRPKGDWINGQGIEPEIIVKNIVPEGDTISRETDAQLDKAVQILIER